MKKAKATLLVVEDDKNLGYIIKDFLEMKGYEVDLEENGQAGLTAFEKKKYDICLLDVMLPVKDGFTLAEEIRTKDCEIPIIFITAKSMDEDRIRGYRIGGDDYINKPFSTEELELRIRAIQKRLKFHDGIISTPQLFKLGKYTFDYANQILSWPEGERKLTKKESQVLHLLCINKNNLLRREIALKTIWGQNDYFMGRSMDVYITKLRKILKDDDTISITNIHNSGFKLEVNEKSGITQQ